MSAKSRGRALMMGTALSLGALARAHDDPAGCMSSGVGLKVSLFRADGQTRLSGPVSECERMFYKVTLAKPEASVCAFSGGTLTLTTADGVAHRLEEQVPCIGGADTERACTPTRTSFQSMLVAYSVRSRDVVNRSVKAIARYDGGMTHDTAADTPGVSAMVDRTVSITSCSDADPCTQDDCDPMKPGIAACSNQPVCDDDDPTTSDTCAGGHCTFTPIASSARVVCGGTTTGRSIRQP